MNALFPLESGPCQICLTLTRSLELFFPVQGVFGRDKLERKKGLSKKKGYIWRSDSSHLEGLLHILEWFDEWRTSLECSSAPGTWKDNFITDMSWYDMRLTILGFVAMSRYIMADESPVLKGEKRKRFLNPRMFSQASRGSSGLI